MHRSRPMRLEIDLAQKGLVYIKDFMGNSVYLKSSYDGMAVSRSGLVCGPPCRQSPQLQCMLGEWGFVVTVTDSHCGRIDNLAVAHARKHFRTALHNIG